MAENVTVFGDLADKFDAMVAYDEGLLDGYVEDSGYSLGSMILASTAISLMRFSQSFLDMGRIGNGILVEGGWTGVAKDVLRGLGFASGVTGGAGRVGGRLLRVTQAAGEKTCIWIAHTNVARLTGQRFLLTMEKLAERAGVSLDSIRKVATDLEGFRKMTSALSQMKIPFQVIQRTGKTLEEAVNLVKGAGRGMTTFGVRYASGGGHRLYAVWSRTAGLVIRDPLGRVYHSLDDLRRALGSNVELSEFPMIFVPNSLLVTGAQLVEQVGGLAAMVLQVIPIINVRAGDVETAAQVLQVREDAATESTPSPATPLPRPTYHVVARGESLSKIARRYYGNVRKWPILYEANRRTIGPDPNMIHPNQKLLVPPLPHVRLQPASNLGETAPQIPLAVA